MPLEWLFPLQQKVPLTEATRRIKIFYSMLVGIKSSNKITNNAGRYGFFNLKVVSNIMGENSRGSRAQAQLKNLRCKNLYEYLKTLPLPILDQLYNHPTTCLAVFRLVFE